MIVNLKRVDDRPRVLWRCLLKEHDGVMFCRMQNTPLENFICNQADNCPLDCIQKIEQPLNADYIREQQKKLLSKIENITQNNGNSKQQNSKKV